MKIAVSVQIELVAKNEEQREEVLLTSGTVSKGRRSCTIEIPFF
jgi:hypothetical protein